MANKNGYKLLPVGKGSHYHYNDFPQVSVLGYGERVTLHQRNNRGEKIILCNGCSFTQSREDKWSTWTDYICGKVYNIAITGSSIEFDRVFDFVNCISEEFTHFVYQVPIYLRQLMYPDLDEDRFLDAEPSVKKRWPIYCEENGLEAHDEQSFRDYQNDNVIMYRNDVFSFDFYESYAKKSLYIIEKKINFLRSRFPGIKIILVKYNHAGYYYKRYETLTKKFFGEDLKKFSIRIGVDYIGHKNFNTYYFYRNDMTIYDKSHLNDKGASLIGKEVSKLL